MEEHRAGGVEQSALFLFLSKLLLYQGRLLDTFRTLDWAKIQEEMRLFLFGIPALTIGTLS